MITVLENIDNLFLRSQDLFRFVKLEHPCNPPLQYAEDGCSHKKSDVAAQVGNECHEGVSVELLIDLQCHH